MNTLRVLLWMKHLVAVARRSSRDIRDVQVTTVSGGSLGPLYYATVSVAGTVASSATIMVHFELFVLTLNSDAREIQTVQFFTDVI